MPLRIVPGEGIDILDQTLLPFQEQYLPIRTVDAASEAIRSLRVRGAPLLGLTGVCALAIAARNDATDAGLAAAAARIVATRPTAVDLAALAHRALARVGSVPVEQRANALWQLATATLSARKAEDRALGEHGAGLLVDATAVLTLQHRRPRDRRDWHGTGRYSLRMGVRNTPAMLRNRDAPVAPGCAPDHLGTDAAWHPHDAAPRHRGRITVSVRPGGGCHHGGRSDSRQWRHRQ